MSTVYIMAYVCPLDRSYLTSRSRDCRFVPLVRTLPEAPSCFVSKTLYPLLSTGSTQEELSLHDQKMVEKKKQQQHTK